MRALLELADVLARLGDAAASLETLALALDAAQEPGAAPVQPGLVRWHYARALWDHAPARRAEAVEVMKACYLDYAAHGEPGDNDEVVAWLRERGEEPPALPAGP